MDNNDNSNQSLEPLFEDEKLVPVESPQLELEGISPIQENPKKEKKKKKKEESKDPYKNMKARKIVLIIGFVLSFVGFALMAFTLASLLAPNTYSSFELFIPLCISSLATSFVGIIFAVAGANTNKAIARLAFLFAILGFVLSAGMLTVIYLSKLLPLEAIDRMVNKN